MSVWLGAAVAARGIYITAEVLHEVFTRGVLYRERNVNSRLRHRLLFVHENTAIFNHDTIVRSGHDTSTVRTWAVSVLIYVLQIEIYRTNGIVCRFHGFTDTKARRCPHHSTHRLLLVRKERRRDRPTDGSCENGTLRPPTAIDGVTRSSDRAIDRPSDPAPCETEHSPLCGEKSFICALYPPHTPH